MADLAAHLDGEGPVLKMNRADLTLVQLEWEERRVEFPRLSVAAGYRSDPPVGRYIRPPLGLGLNAYFDVRFHLPKHGPRAGYGPLVLGCHCVWSKGRPPNNLHDGNALQRAFATRYPRFDDDELAIRRRSRAPRSRDEERIWEIFERHAEEDGWGDETYGHLQASFTYGFNDRVWAVPRHTWVLSARG